MKLPRLFAVVIWLATIASVPFAYADGELHAPTNVSIQDEGTAIKITWTAPEASDVPVERYAIFFTCPTCGNGYAIASGNAGDESALKTFISIDKSQLPDSSYTFKVRADNDTAGVYSQFSEQANVVIEPTVVAPAPTPTPSVSSEPTPTPSPEPSIAPSPTPTAESTPSPSREPTQSSIPSPEPTASPTMVESSPSPSPESSQAPSPQPIPTLIPSPTPSVDTSTPEPIQPTPQPIQEPLPTPVVEPEPTPVIVPKPEPIPAPLPEPIPEPTPEPTPVEVPTPVEEPPTPVDEPPVEPPIEQLPVEEPPVVIADPVDVIGEPPVEELPTVIDEVPVVEEPPVAPVPVEEPLVPTPIQSGLQPNSPDQLPVTEPKVPENNLLVAHIQQDVTGVENGGIQFFGTQSQPQVIDESGKLTPPPPVPGSGDPIPPDAITTEDTFIGQVGGVTFNSPDVAVIVELVAVDLPAFIDSIPSVGDAIQSINTAYVALANIGNDMSPITRKKAKKVLVATIIAGPLFRRKFGE
jgi:hypothetical protein